MKSLIIRRIQTGENGTFGALIFESIPFAVTLEREWLDNKSNISCIPSGEYMCERVDSPRFGDTFEVKDVKNRSHILFHKGNLDDDSYGCILIGESFGAVGNSSGIVDSRGGFNEFKAILSDDDQFRLIIVDDFLTDLIK